MSLSLLQNVTAIGINRSTSFSGTGGVPPYTYSVVPGGAGGSIGSLTGIYTSPLVSGSDTIKVVDSLAAQATANIAILNHVELVCDIIQKEMSLANGQVYLWDQKIDTPQDFRLYAVISILSCKPFGNKAQFNGTVEVQSTNFQATLSIDIFSRGPEARDRKEEVIMALNSNYARQQMEANSFHIARISSGFVNLSNQDGPAIPYRFNISVNMQYSIGKTKVIPYFDSFQEPSVLTDP